MTIFSRKWLKEHGYTPQPDGSLSNEHSANISAVAPATGSAAKAKKDPKLPRPPSPLATKFEALWAGHGGPALTPELRFHKTRKWRFDYAWPDRKLFLEVDGGVDAEIARLCTAAGADVLVAGTATFRGGPAHYAANIASLRG